MPYRVGTIVTRYETDKESEYVAGGFRACKGYNYPVPDDLDNLNVSDICVGIITEDSNSDVKVLWSQMCSDHASEHILHERCDYDELWEIGQIF